VSPAEVVQRQFDAYNAHDLAAFLETYSEKARIYRMPATSAAMSGKAEISELYRTKVFNVAGHKAELLRRIASGNKVVDHERVFGLREQPFEVVAVYEVSNDRIQCDWLFPAE